MEGLSSAGFHLAAARVQLQYNTSTEYTSIVLYYVVLG